MIKHNNYSAKQIRGAGLAARGY